MIRLFNVSIPPATFILLALETLLLSGSFLLATVAVGDLDPVDYLLADSGILALLLVVLCFLLAMHFQGLYASIRVQSRVLLIQQLCMATGVAFLAQGLISYLDSDLRVSVPVMLLGSGLAVPCIFLGRLWFGNLAGQMIGHTRLVLLGDGPTIAQLRAWIKTHPESGLIVEASAENVEEIAALDRMVRKQQPPRVIFSSWGEPAPELVHEAIELQLSGYEVETAAAAYERASSRISLYGLRPEELIFSGAFAVSRQKVFYQLVFNGAVAVVCLLVTLPMLLVTAVLLRLSTRGPIWRAQTVLGQHGRAFRLYRLLALGEGAVARTVRRLHFDKLPEFLNVLRGDLAIVGPRAQRLEYVEAIERHIPFYRERLAVKPGMSGWAQIHLDPHFVVDAMTTLEYDLYYIKNMSLALDTLILLHTARAILVEPGLPALVPAGEEVGVRAETH